MMQNSDSLSRAERAIMENVRHHAALWRYWKIRERNDASLRLHTLAAGGVYIDMVQLGEEAGFTWSDLRDAGEDAGNTFERVHRENRWSTPESVDPQVLIDAGLHWIYGVYRGRALAAAQLERWGWTLAGEPIEAEDGEAR